jgi:hypothetical protein
MVNACQTTRAPNVNGVRDEPFFKDTGSAASLAASLTERKVVIAKRGVTFRTVPLWKRLGKGYGTVPDVVLGGGTR